MMTTHRNSENERDTREARGKGPGLAAHIRVWMLGVGLVPLVILFAYGYLAARSALQEASDDHLLSVVGARRARIESWLNERTTDLEVISRSQDCNALVHEAASHQEHARVCRYLDSFQTGARDYQVLSLYDRNWNWVASQTGSEIHAGRPVDPQLKAELVNQEGPVLSTVQHHDDRGIGLSAGNVLRAPDGEVTGYVIASLDLTGTFAPILEDRAGLGQGGRVMLGDAKGDLLLTNTGEAPDGARLDPEIVTAAEKLQTGTLHFKDASGHRVFAGFTVIPSRGWILAAVMNQEEALALLYALRRGFLIAGLVTLVAIIILSSRSSRRLSKPLAELAGAARRISGATPHERVPVSGGREVAEVGRAFNETLDALEEVQRRRIQASTLAAVGELSSNIVHEMRNRLSSVKMNLQALERHLDGDRDYSELARIALDQVRRTEDTLTDLLNYARPVEPVVEPVPIASLLTGLAGQFRAEATSRSVDLVVEDLTRGGAVRADRKLLEQALSNLIRNGLEAAPTGSRLTLRAVPREDGAGWIDLEVEDDGPGFNGTSTDDLFQPFFTTKDRGAGLGLAQARKITELHGGRISAGPGAGGGALFRLGLPRSEDAK